MSEQRADRKTSEPATDREHVDRSIAVRRRRDRPAWAGGTKPWCIVATDSGLGGLSVVANLVTQLQQRAPMPRVKVVYFNCLPSRSLGFNQMDEARQVRVFNRVLHGIVQTYSPDDLLIACNTLTTVYPHTAFAKAPPTPVTGIVDTASQLIAERLARDPQLDAILLGTPITVRSQVYRQRLIDAGVDQERLFEVGCDGLATSIGTNGANGQTQALVSMAIEAVHAQRTKRYRNAILCLVCTHYGYVSSLIESMFTAAGHRIVDTIDPNEQMATRYMATLEHVVEPPVSVEVEVATQAGHSEVTKRCVSRFLKTRSPETVEALWQDRQIPGLFAID